MKMDYKLAVIVIPIYQRLSKLYEKVSMNQALDILGRYPICFVMPERMKEQFYIPNNCYAEYFADDFFLDRESYSNLLISEMFYERFEMYEYMLVYQLDTFAFSDRLYDFCSLGYDYIGAPWPRWRIDAYSASVGNGGFSLRNIKSCKRVVSEQGIVKEKLGKEEFYRIIQSEDVYFSVCSRIKELNFKVPSTRIASLFSVEWNVSKRYYSLKEDIPFGCHGWQRDSYKFWRPLIKRYINRATLIALDKELDEDKDGFSYFDEEKHVVIPCVYNRTIKYGGLAIMIKAWNEYQEPNSHYSIWGGGKIGRECIRFLEIVSAHIDFIYDNDVKEVNGFLCTKPMWNYIEKNRGRLLIATSRYKKEISSWLESRGWIKNVDYFIYTEFVRGFIEWWLFDKGRQR